MSGGAGHGVVIDYITCGGCGNLMENVEGEMTWRCVNAECKNALKEWRPRILIDEIVRPQATIPGVET
ncbi:MAG TPA: hypothetical protein VFE27_24370 [Acidobacteriaceae bacterium]|jgi:hypothetical protein|nr:hypothetical protein [Acidobacteriaceae bacterium]